MPDFIYESATCNLKKCHLLRLTIQESLEKMKLTFMTIAHEGGRARVSSPVMPTQEHTDNNSSHIKIKPHKG